MWYTCAGAVPYDGSVGIVKTRVGARRTSLRRSPAATSRPPTRSSLRPQRLAPPGRRGPSTCSNARASVHRVCDVEILGLFVTSIPVTTPTSSSPRSTRRCTASRPRSGATTSRRSTDSWPNSRPSPCGSAPTERSLGGTAVRRLQDAGMEPGNRRTSHPQAQRHRVGVPWPTETTNQQLTASGVAPLRLGPGGPPARRSRLVLRRL